MRKPNNKQRKGFTIVELVIVIAVVAVLAGVMIPTFGGIIETANRSADTQLVAQINTILFVEDMLNGDGNDAVEIQNIVRENGLELKTKTKGLYIWYDTANKKAVLAGLDANGIVLSDADKDANDPATKGQFKAASAPEDFIEGYLFLSTESPDGLAEAICALRNPAGADDATISASLAEALVQLNDLKEKVDSAEAVATRMSALMGTTAVMTNNGLGYIGNDKSKVIKIIISADMTQVTAGSLNDLLAKDNSGNEIYPNIKYVSFHSNVVDIEQNAVELIKANADMYFFYSNSEVQAIDMANGDIANLARIDEISSYFTSVVVIDTSDGSKYTEWRDLPGDTYTFSYTGLVYELKAGTAETSYDFVGYSLYENGANLLTLCSDVTDTKSYTLTGEEKTLIDENNQLTIYQIYNTATSDFKIGDAYYSSKTMTSMLDDDSIASLPNGTTTIAVVSSDAKLDASLIGKTAADLSLDGVELLLPWQITGETAYEKAPFDPTHPAMYTKDIDGKDVTIKGINEKLALDDPEQTYHKGLMNGKTKLTIADNVNLKVEDDGSIYVDARFYTAGTSYQCVVTNDCGVLVVDGIINSDGDITAWGVIRGDGTINAKKGSVVEAMTIYDWYGGTNALYSVVINSDKVTPFNEWKSDNIRAKLNVYGDAKYAAQGAISMSSVVGIDFALTSSSDSDKPLFKTTSTTIVSKSCTYDGHTQLSIVGGEVTDQHKSIDIPISSIAIPDILKTIVSVLGIKTVSIDFSQMSLPLSHFGVTIEPGAKLTISENIYKMMPGSSIIVESNYDEELGERVDGVLTIATDVVICNSFDLEFEISQIEDKTQAIGEDNAARWLIKYALDDDRDAFIATKQKQTSTLIKEAEGCEEAQYEWNNTNDAPVLDASLNLIIPHTYSVTTPAQFIVNGILNFKSGASFAGNITSTKEGATMNVDVAVGGCEISEGLYIQHALIGDNWYDIYDPDLIKVPMFVKSGSAIPQQLTGTGKYTFDGSVWNSN